MKCMNMTNNFISRIIEGTLFSLIALLAIVFAYTMPLGCWFFAFLLIGTTSLACWEYCQMVQRKGIKPFTPLLLLTGSGYLLLHAASLFHLINDTVSIFWLLLGLLALSIPILRSAEEIVFPTAVTLLGFIYIFIPAQLLLNMTYLPGPEQESPNRWWLVWLLLIVKGSDSAAYFGGKLFGKKPLTTISPKKTWEGFFIGCLGGAILSWAMGFCFTAPKLNSLTFLLLGGLLSAIACIGDLIESRLKREVGVKDSNNIPGLGGVLDMADSLLFTIPFVYVCFNLLGGK